MYLFDDLTLIIATYGQRHHFVKRTVRYWEDTGAHILILDASPRAISKSTLAKFPSKTTYFHYPQVDYFKRLSIASKLVKTKYVLIHPDDDFNFKSVVSKCLNELDSDDQLLACDGVYSWFSFHKSQLFSLYTNSISKICNSISDDPIERLEMSFNSHYIYGIWRTEIIRICFARWPKKVSSPSVFVMAFQWILAYLGKWKP